MKKHLIVTGSKSAIELSIENSQLTELDCCEISNEILKFDKIKSVRLNNIKTSAVGLKEMITALTVHPEITSLDFSNNLMPDELGRYLLVVIQYYLPALKFLELRGNQFSRQLKNDYLDLEDKSSMLTVNILDEKEYNYLNNIINTLQSSQITTLEIQHVQEANTVTFDFDGDLTNFNDYLTSLQRSQYLSKIHTEQTIIPHNKRCRAKITNPHLPYYFGTIASSDAFVKNWLISKGYSGNSMLYIHETSHTYANISPVFVQSVKQPLKIMVLDGEWIFSIVEYEEPNAKEPFYKVKLNLSHPQLKNNPILYSLVQVICLSNNGELQQHRLSPDVMKTIKLKNVLVDHSNEGDINGIIFKDQIWATILFDYLKENTEYLLSCTDTKKTESIKLSKILLSNDSLFMIMTMLGESPIKLLELDNCSFPFDGMDKLCEYLKDNVTLTHFKIILNDSCPSRLMMLLKALESNSSLKRIEICGRVNDSTKYYDEDKTAASTGLHQLCSLLGTNNTLRHIDLSALTFSTKTYCSQYYLNDCKRINNAMQINKSVSTLIIKGLEVSPTDNHHNEVCEALKLREQLLQRNKDQIQSFYKEIQNLLLVFNKKLITQRSSNNSSNDTIEEENLNVNNTTLSRKTVPMIPREMQFCFFSQMAKSYQINIPEVTVNSELDAQSPLKYKA